MATHYGTPFKLYAVKDPRTGARKQLTDAGEGKALAQELAKSSGAKTDDLIVESRTYYVWEYTSGAKRGRRVNTGEETKLRASAWCQARVRERRGALRCARKPLGEALDEWLEELEALGRSPKTLHHYRGQTNVWRAHFDGRLVEEISSRDIFGFFKAKSKIRSASGKERNASPQLLNLNRVLWKAFMKWCRRRSYAEGDPTDDLKRWKEPKREARVLSPEEVSRLIKACREPYGIVVKREAYKPYEKEVVMTPPPVLYPVVACALTTLLRLGNVLDLRWGEVDLERDEIRIPAEKVKTRAELVLPLGRVLKALLLALPKGGPEDHVFGGQREIKRAFGNALRRAKLKGASFHALRRTGATHLLQARVPREVVERLGGWRTSGGVMLEHYRRVDVEELRSAVAKLDDLVTGGARETTRRDTLQAP